MLSVVVPVAFAMYGVSSKKLYKPELVAAILNVEPSTLPFRPLPSMP
jgi:hypothetical protein